jgi:phosphatidate cytidylyltransferase
MVTKAGSARWADLRLRIASAAVLAPLALLCIWAGGVAFAALVAAISVGLGYEWLGMCGRRSSPAVILVYAALPVAVVLMEGGHAGWALGLLAVASLAGMFAGRGAAAWPVPFGVPYLGLGAVSLVWLRAPAGGGAANVIVLLLLVWASDIGAYVAGRALGGKRLAPSISPGKTWSGAVGGLVAVALVGAVASSILGHGAPSWHVAAFAVAIGVISQAGDLFESQLKRHFGVKDSGSMIPGHGGLLDRLDAVLTAAPAAALLALVLGRGVVLWQ